MFKIKYILYRFIVSILTQKTISKKIKKGKKIEGEKKFFPGYVLVKIELTKQIYHLIKNLQKVSKEGRQL